MSRILADAKPAPPRVGCVLLRCRLGARGRDGERDRNIAEIAPFEHKALAEDLAVVAGRIVGDSEPSEAFFVDPAEMLETYGGPEAWARCVKGYLNARGFGVSVSLADTERSALEAARSRWGIVVSQPTASYQNDSRLGRIAGRTGIDRRADAGPSDASRSGAARPTSPTNRRGAEPSHGQLGLPGVKIGKPKRAVRKPSPPDRRAA